VVNPEKTVATPVDGAAAERRGKRMSADMSLDVRYYRLSEELQADFTALYMFDMACGQGCLFEDYLHPEWAAMRFSCGTPPAAAIGPGPLEPQWPFVVSGPTSKAIHFSLTTARIWGLGLQPGGWARFVDAEARDFTDRTVDGANEPAFALFAPILPLTQDPARAPDKVAEDINAYLMGHAGRVEPRLEQVQALHAALRDPEVAHVSELEQRLGLGMRSLERICARYFGFPPKLLLRRQRFLRSLARYMLAPHGNWSDAIDDRYYDQAQFVRDFRSFMGMTPSEYADHPHPVLSRIMAQRMADQGAAGETDLPTMLRYGGMPAGADLASGNALSE